MYCLIVLEYAITTEGELDHTVRFKAEERREKMQKEVDKPQELSGSDPEKKDPRYLCPDSSFTCFPVSSS